MFFVDATGGAVVGARQLAAIPDHLQGRVNGAMYQVTLGSVPIASLVVGVLLQTWGPNATILALGVVMIATTIAAVRQPGGTRAAGGDARVERGGVRLANCWHPQGVLELVRQALRGRGVDAEALQALSDGLRMSGVRFPRGTSPRPQRGRAASAGSPP